MNNGIAKIAAFLLMCLLLIGVLGSVGCGAPAPMDTAGDLSTQGQTEDQPSSSEPKEPPEEGQPEAQPSERSPAVVSVVAAGYITHGPMQPTVRAIDDVLSKYSGKVDVTWVDLSTREGRDYFREHGLTAHMNVIIDGRYTYEVNGRDVTFQWFEGRQWTKEDLDVLLSDLVGE